MSTEDDPREDAGGTVLGTVTEALPSGLYRVVIDRQRAASAMFLRGWLAAVEGSVVVPKEHAAIRVLLDAFLLEQVATAYRLNPALLGRVNAL